MNRFVNSFWNQMVSNSRNFVRSSIANYHWPFSNDRHEELGHLNMKNSDSFSRIPLDEFVVQVSNFNILFY